MAKSKSKNSRAQGRRGHIFVPCGNNQVAEFDLIKMGLLAAEDVDDETTIYKAVRRIWESNVITGELPGWTSPLEYYLETPFRVIEGGKSIHS